MTKQVFGLIFSVCVASALVAGSAQAAVCAPSASVAQAKALFQGDVDQAMADYNTQVGAAVQARDEALQAAREKMNAELASLPGGQDQSGQTLNSAVTEYNAASAKA